MIQTRIGYPATPAMDRRGWCFYELGQRGSAPEIVYDLIAEPEHGSNHAIIASHCQGCVCDKRNCGNHALPLHGAMDVETLKRLMTEHGENQAGIARLLNVSADKISKTLAGKRNLNLREANILRDYFGLDVTENASTMLPIVGLVSAGGWREGFENIMGYMPSPDKGLSRDAFVVIVEGDSMDKVAQPGEGIVIDPRDLDLVSGRYYVIRNAEGETTFKQYRDNPARLEPCSNNPTHVAIYPGRDNFTVVGRAKKRVSDL